VVIKLVKALRKYGICLLFLFMFSSYAEAQDILRAVVTGDEVNIRSAPSSKGKVFGRVDKYYTFLVDAVPIQDESDGSKWYKILFDYDFNFYFLQAHRMHSYDFSYPYISARFVRIEPLEEYEQWELDYLKQGRPTDDHVGDDLSISFRREEMESYVLKVPVALYKEPRSGADRIVIPAETAVLFGIHPETGALYNHLDIDDVPWFYVMDENIKILGWATGEEVDIIVGDL